jgi:cytoskeletal protein CcmA (bactofilin family)
MWRRTSEDEAPAPASAPAAPVERAAAPEAATRISSSIRITGQIVGREDVFLDGELAGSVRVEGARVTVGPQGRLAASIEAQEIVVLGKVEGDLRAWGRVELGPGATVRGDIVTPRLKIAEGAVVRGRIETDREPPRPAARAANSAATGPGTSDAVH